MSNRKRIIRKGNFQLVRARGNRKNEMDYIKMLQESCKPIIIKKKVNR